MVLNLTLGLNFPLRVRGGVGNLGRLLNSMLRILSSLALVLVVTSLRAGEVRLDLIRAGSQATVQLSGEVGQEYLIESARGSADQWAPVTSFVLSDLSKLWMDAAADSGNRFFRARTADPARDAADFRLIDQNGVSRELYYYAPDTTLEGIVLVFTEGNYGAFAPQIAALKANPTFANSVLFWTIETGVNNTRSNILKQATAAGMTWPVYHDPMQVVTHDYGAHFNGEAFVISPASMTIVYRGVIDDGVNHYMADALASLHASGQVMTTRLEPSQGAFAAPAHGVADYVTQVAPLIQTKCVVCHAPGNIGKFAVTNYASFVTNTDKIKTEVMAGRMPPWHADPEFGKFHNDISLSPAQKTMLLDWLDAGAPRGASTEDPLTNYASAPIEWPAELGPPDQIVTIPVQQVEATGTLAYRYIYANTTNTTDKWLKAAFVRPSNKKVVHHYIVWQGHSSVAQLSGIAGYAPGRTERPFPDGTGVLLPANCPVTFNLHYTADGEPEEDQPELALWYADVPPAKELKTIAASNALFFLGSTQIPAGNGDFELTANAYVVNNQATFGAIKFNVPTRVYSLSPHMHFRGSRMRFELVQPSGRTILLSVPHYNFDWQTIYSFETPIDVPAGATINVVGAFDNSALNLDNPDPTVGVTWGEQSWDEMFIGYIEYSQ